MGEPKRVLKAVKQAEKNNRDANRTETRLSDFGVSGEVHVCEKCSKDISANVTHLKIFESEFSRKVVRRRCMMCCATWRKEKGAPKSAEKPPEPPEWVVTPKKSEAKAPPEKKAIETKQTKEQPVAEEPGDKKIIGNLLSKFKDKK